MRLRRMLFGGPRTPEEEAENEESAKERADAAEKERLRLEEEERKRQLRENQNKDIKDIRKNLEQKRDTLKQLL